MPLDHHVAASGWLPPRVHVCRPERIPAFLAVRMFLLRCLRPHPPPPVGTTAPGPSSAYPLPGTQACTLHPCCRFCSLRPPLLECLCSHITLSLFNKACGRCVSCWTKQRSLCFKHTGRSSPFVSAVVDVATAASMGYPHHWMCETAAVPYADGDSTVFLCLLQQERQAPCSAS